MSHPERSYSINANLADTWNQEIYYAEVKVVDGIINSIKKLGGERRDSHYILPGFIDSHVHIESSMLLPTEFAKLAVVHGTVATISDPHEIANVCGIEGVDFMINNGKEVPFKFYFGAPSCVPATTFETAGAALKADEVEHLLARPEIKYLSEMMNFPGVLFKDEEVVKKIASSHRLGKPVDGHAPGLRGEPAKQYIEAGISTDHECFTAEEALDKLQYGMKILIREGSAAKNFDALIDLLNDHAEMMMFCSDDKHPDSLLAGHINQLCARAVAKGVSIFKVLQAACINPVQHYKLEVGLLRAGDAADFIIAENIIDFKINNTFINGEMVAENGKSYISAKEATPINNFHCDEKKQADFSVKHKGEVVVHVIEALDGQLITNHIQVPGSLLLGEDGLLHSNIDEDILKICVINRYEPAPVSMGWVRNFGFRTGAIASTVAHDSHNIIAVGVDDESICEAVNLVIREKGGISVFTQEKTGNPLKAVLALPVAGLMSTGDGYMVAGAYTAIDVKAKSLGSSLAAPFMTLSFMALLVIPHIKLSDKGLFNGDEFKFFDR